MSSPYWNAMLQASRAFQARQALRAPQAPQAQQPRQAPVLQAPAQAEQHVQLQQVPQDTMLLMVKDGEDAAAENGGQDEQDEQDEEDGHDEQDMQDGQDGHDGPDGHDEPDGQDGQEADAPHEPDDENVPPPPPPGEDSKEEARSLIWIDQIIREDGTVFPESEVDSMFQRPGHPEYMVSWMEVGSATVCPVVYWVQHPYPDWDAAPVEALDLEFRRVRALYPPNVTLHGMIFRGRWARLYRELRPWAVGVDAPIRNTLVVQESMELNMKEEAGVRHFAAWRYSLPENALREWNDFSVIY
ncbi:hypothetical protein BO86DRAFT_381852 [Aspergillus japonicus CBS 114.51]|uniref:Uncharacterized protein n=1 Tax=Aspergillus japonicus CBS 114.51 TaxID=1448312 RepID=A0A8T8WTD2_ASPJA|nr:hypothetical protein BO86DRAFT_381852 [Aspergillus japonicus CBS 114.51]RAH78762.1 hypothetical protein BO86DRAFT_381852 [Aspergillus japonicus CBS 114.51]